MTGVAEAAASGVEAGEQLLAYADAAIEGEPEAVARTREAVRARLGDAATVDAAGVIGNFERMVRIADGTGIPLDAPVAFMSADLREELGIDAYGSAQNTRPLGRAARWASRAMQPLLRVAVRRFAGR